MNHPSNFIAGKERRHISVCVCTFRRPAMLHRLLESLLRQQGLGEFTFSVVVVDNDAVESARHVVDAFAAAASMAVVYCVEPRQNIALARNMAIKHARGEYIVLIDDDEFPADDWLERLVKLCEVQNVAGVLGPVRPHFESAPSSWILRGGFCDRPEHPTGTVVQWEHARTGNVLFLRSILDDVSDPFLATFGTGGEDQDFFRRMIERGHRFIWCNEAVVYETVPAARQTRSYMLRRALLRGRNSLKHPEGRVWRVFKSIAAVPLYSLSLPVMLLRGQHWFMRYLIKLCDHLGRILTLCRINPIHRREM